MAHGLYRGAALGGFPFGGILPMIIGIALVALVVVLFIRNNKLKKKVVAADTSIAPESAVSPTAILKERLAKGEINEEEFDKLLLKINQ